MTVRNDTGVYEGGEISIYYDPMIAKLVTHAPTAREAIAAQAEALDAFAIEGIRHNIPFLSALMEHPRWQEGALSTGFIAEEFPTASSRSRRRATSRCAWPAVAAAIDHLHNERKRAHLGPDAASRGGAVRARAGGDARARAASRSWSRMRRRHRGGASTARPCPSRSRTGGRASRSGPGTVGGEAVAVQVRPLLNGYRAVPCGHVAPRRGSIRAREAELAALMPEKLAADTGKTLLCPMPGLVKAILRDDRPGGEGRASRSAWSRR